MTEIYDDEDANRPRTLTNTEVIGFMWRHWMGEPRRFVLIDAVATPTSPAQTAWIAWASLHAVTEAGA